MRLDNWPGGPRQHTLFILAPSANRSELTTYERIDNLQTRIFHRLMEYYDHCQKVKLKNSLNYLRVIDDDR